MIIQIPYSHTDININTNHNGDLILNIAGDSFAEELLTQLIDQLSYEQIIDMIGPQEFETISTFYQANYKD